MVCHSAQDKVPHACRKVILTISPACGDIPATGDDEPNGDLFIKYVSEPTPAECQDIRLQVTFAAGTGTMEWAKPYDCMVFNHGIC